MALIGLTAARRARLKLGLDLDQLVEGIAHRWREIENWGELGLLLWCLSDHYGVSTRACEEVLERIQATPNVLRHLNTSELGWLLTGLSRTAIVSRESKRVRELARTVFAGLRANYDTGSSLFCYGGQSGGPLRRWLRRRLGFFDNQVYGIYASAVYSMAFGDDGALQIADRCARQICALQGPLGQWAWHYNVRTGRVVDRYPVYSVHQDGMGPMALGLLSALTGKDYSPWLGRSVAWLFGENELGRNLVGPDAGLIWRSIRRRSPYRRLIYLNKFLSLLGLERTQGRIARVASAQSKLEVDLECRPYHLGWLLLAFTEQGIS